MKTLACTLPLWLVSLSITAEGFTRPPISVEVAAAAIIHALIISSVLLWKRWMSPELFLYSLIPFAFLLIFDEISTTYKTPFILLCALILTAGIIGYLQQSDARWRWLVLLSGATLTLLMANHVTDSYWQMAADLGYERCFPDAHGCPPLKGNETPWWVLILRL